MKPEHTVQDVVDLLEEMKKVLELKGENPFKVRAFEKAAHNLLEQFGATDSTAKLEESARAKTLTDIPGVGKGIAEVLTEFLTAGHSKMLDDLKASLPEGLVELTEISGVGPKKALLLIEELGIRSVGELEYACKENRLLKLTGFGPKLQSKILEGIRFQKSTQGKQRLSDAFDSAKKTLDSLTSAAPGARVSETGALRRRLEILTELEFLVEGSSADLEKKLEKAVKSAGSQIPVRLHYSESKRFGYELARTTGTAEHWKALGSPAAFDARTEEAFFEKLSLPFIPAEARETGEEVALAKKGELEKLLPWHGVQGVFHNHTTRSDGVNTVEEMVRAAAKLGYKYIGISDHSQSAFYAQGLKIDALKEQEKEIRAVQEKHPEIQVFWGIESDILADGSLDYDPKVLGKFDFVVASVHSRFNMDREAMTDRIIAAIRNPHTRFLGHATGRILLGRPGYELNMEKVIKAAAENDVAIEINANPARLDIDWRWGKELRKQKTLVSVNPDAHEIAGLEDTAYGIAVARKALLPSSQVVNSRTAAEVDRWLKRA
jgi:DNA polymerase (family 10)